MTTNELEWRLLYSVLVAGKSARFAQTVMDRLFPDKALHSPLGKIREWDRGSELKVRCFMAKTGCYGRIVRSFREIKDAALDLATCTPADLERIHGIGPKTARFFILWTRPGVRYAALDVHVLRWLRSNGLDAPKATPSSPHVYAFWEKKFLDLCDKLGVSARDLDSAIWSSATGIY